MYPYVLHGLLDDTLDTINEWREGLGMEPVPDPCPDMVHVWTRFNFFIIDVYSPSTTASQLQHLYKETYKCMEEIKRVFPHKAGPKAGGRGWNIMKFGDMLNLVDTIPLCGNVQVSGSAVSWYRACVHCTVQNCTSGRMATWR